MQLNLEMSMTSKDNKVLLEKCEKFLDDRVKKIQCNKSTNNKRILKKEIIQLFLKIQMK